MAVFNIFKPLKPVDPAVRREKNNAFIKSKGIKCFDNLPVRETSRDVKLKDIDTICKRALACLFTIQVACDVEEGRDVKESAEFFTGFMKRFGVENMLLEKEKALMTGNTDKQLLVDIVWSYEIYWAMLWALGLVENIQYPDSICDCRYAITVAGDCDNYRQFKSKCKLRNIEEILDMLDLYYRYHWACVEKQINPQTDIKDIIPDVVWERRRGLEWLISPENDWNNISLDT